MKTVLFALLAGCALLCNAAAEEQQTTSKVPDKAPDQTAAPAGTPLIIRNADGTFTLQKVPVGKDKDPRAKKGLVIPPQVVIPIIPAKK